MEFQIKKAEPEQYETVISLIRNVHDTMPQKEWFIIDNADDTKMILTAGIGTAYIAICQNNKEIAGILITVIPGNSPDNLGKDIELPKHELTKVVHMDSVAVLPAYRGHHLYQKLVLAAEADLVSSGYHYLCCTIHPENQYSMNNAHLLGYKVMKVCEKYGRYLRAVLMKEI